MAKYSYEAVDKTGAQKTGVIDAASPEEAREKLRGQGLFPTTINQKGKGKKSSGSSDQRKRLPAWQAGKVKSKQLTAFTRQFSTLLDSGLPLVRALDIMEKMIPSGAMLNATMDLRDEVEGGSSLSDSMAKDSKTFDVLYCSMIKAGEASGQLGKILGRLAEFREKSEKLKSQIISALIYPAAVLTIATGILILIILLVVPEFQKMFIQMNVPLPGPTQVLLTLSDIMTTVYFGVIPAVLLYIIGIPLGLFIILKLVRSNELGLYYTDMAMLHMPIFGQILKKSSVSRFCRTMGELDSAGVPILDSLSIIKDAISNKVIRTAVEDIHVGIREGESMSEPMRRSNQFDLMTLNMVEVGEETGELDKMLIRVADNYDSDVDTLVGGMMSLMEPFMIIGMGIAVGFIVISLFLPLLGIVSNLSG